MSSLGLFRDFWVAFVVHCVVFLVHCVVFVVHLCCIVLYLCCICVAFVVHCVVFVLHSVALLVSHQKWAKKRLKRHNIRFWGKNLPKIAFEWFQKVQNMVYFNLYVIYRFLSISDHF